MTRSEMLDRSICFMTLDVNRVGKLAKFTWYEIYLTPYIIQSLSVQRSVFLSIFTTAFDLPANVKCDCYFFLCGIRTHLLLTSIYFRDSPHAESLHTQLLQSYTAPIRPC